MIINETPHVHNVSWEPQCKHIIISKYTEEKQPWSDGGRGLVSKPRPTGPTAAPVNRLSKQQPLLYSGKKPQTNPQPMIRYKLASSKLSGLYYRSLEWDDEMARAGAS